MPETVGMVLIEPDAQPLATGVPLAARVVLVSANLDDFIVLDPNLESALIASQYTRCFFPFVHDRLQF